MQVTIKGVEYTLKTTLRAVIIFERITKKTFSLNLATDQYVFFYSVILANNNNVDMTIDQFLDALDEDPNLIVQFAEFLQSENAEYLPKAEEQKGE